MKKIPILVFLAVLITLASLPGQAQSPPSGAILLPVNLQGPYQPVSGTEFTDQLQAVLQKVGKAGHVVRLSAETLQGLKDLSSQLPPSPAVAEALCNQANRRFCVWISLKMDATMGNESDHLAMSATSRFWTYDSVQDTVVLDAPVASLHSLPFPENASAGDLQQATNDLVTQNVEDLALQIVTLVEQEAANLRVRGWQAATQARTGVPTPPPAEASELFRGMEKACQDYGKAVADGDLMATQDALKRAYTSWPQLNSQEQQLIEQHYPGTETWMNGGVWYGGGYYYPPYWVR